MEPRTNIFFFFNHYVTIIIEHMFDRDRGLQDKIQVETGLTFSSLFSKIVAGAHPRLVGDKELSHSSLDEVHIGLTN